MATTKTMHPSTTRRKKDRLRSLLRSENGFSESKSRISKPYVVSSSGVSSSDPYGSDVELSDDNGEVVLVKQPSRPRRRRKKKTTDEGPCYDSDENNEMISDAPASRDDAGSRQKPRKGWKSMRKIHKRKVDGPGDESGNDSDTGESYRKYCMSTRGMSAKSCLRKPRRFLQNGLVSTSSAADADIDDHTTDPPSPTVSEMDDDELMPASFPVEGLLRYSLRSAVGDGGSGQPDGPSVMDRRDLRPNGIGVDVSHWSDQGRRPYMEDRYVIEDLGSVQMSGIPLGGRRHLDGQGDHSSSNRLPTVALPITWVGIFDGHGGDRASQYCADWLSSYVRHQEHFPSDLGYAMKLAYNVADDDFVGTGCPDGTTACSAAIIGGQQIVCANAGDSRAIVVRVDGTIAKLSRDHKPGMPEETRRITDLGGKVVYWGRWRVEGMLAVSRSVGDAFLKPYITADPEICEYDIGINDRFLVLASDGIWDVLSNEQVANFVLANTCFVEDGMVLTDSDSLKWTARRLCEHASKSGSTDNFSAIVVDLHSYQGDYGDLNFLNA